jgi:hypothetical protein
MRFFDIFLVLDEDSSWSCLVNGNARGRAAILVEKGQREKVKSSE